MSKRLGGIKGCKYSCFSHSAHWLPARKKLLYTLYWFVGCHRVSGTLYRVGLPQQFGLEFGDDGILFPVRRFHVFDSRAPSAGGFSRRRSAGG